MAVFRGDKTRFDTVSSISQQAGTNEKSEPTTEVANGFYNRWNLPQCFSAIDGKYIAMRCPRKPTK